MPRKKTINDVILKFRYEDNIIIDENKLLEKIIKA